MNDRQGWYYAIIEWFARNAVAANLLMAILLLGGFSLPPPPGSDAVPLRLVDTPGFDPVNDPLTVVVVPSERAKVGV